MSDEATQEKIHDSGLPKPPPSQGPHHYIQAIPGEGIPEKQNEQTGEQL